MEMSSDFTRVDVELDDVVASASAAATATLAEFIERYRGETSRESRVKTSNATHSHPRRSFMRDLVSSDLFSSVYEDARERVEESACEGAEEFFDAEEAIRELSQSMGEESTVSDACVSRGAFECVVRCPNVTVDVPFDASVTRATVRNARCSPSALARRSPSTTRRVRTDTTRRTPSTCARGGVK